ASLATLADAWAPLMRKRGDALYWLFWMAQFGFLPAMLSHGKPHFSAWQVLDVLGVSPLLVGLSQLMDLASVSVGGSPFNAALPVLHMPAGLWTLELVALRVGAMGVAMLPLLPAIWLFHRYAPDRVTRATAGRNLLIRALQWLLHPALRPITWLLARLLRLSARVPGAAGRWLADVSLTLLSQPLLSLWMAACGTAAAWVPLELLPPLMAMALAAWGLAISDISARDSQHGTLALACAAPGGALERGWRQAVAAFGIGVAVSAPALVRWGADAPLRSAACIAGLLCLSAGAALLGRLTQGSRTFLALFLFGLYLDLQPTDIAMLDLLGLNGAATAASVAAYAGLGGLALSVLILPPRQARM
ncbi:MAG: hypothetical protein ABW220_06725, partial [Burkholderiaceae bacterium]